MKRIIAAVFAATLPLLCFGAGPIDPSTTYLFAEKDSCSLYLDIYEPAEGSITEIDGAAKPTILFVFGGGFVKGTRDSDWQKGWYAALTKEGFRVVAIDYRLGMKGHKGGSINKAFIQAMDHSIDIAVEDLFSATSFIIDNKDELGIDPDNIVISGSSAGAITVLQGEWEICNSTEMASVLPEGFNYVGVIAFAGAIRNNMGGPVYAKEPCPTLLLYGTKDDTVPFGKVKIGKIYFGGSSSLADAYKKAGYNFGVYRFLGNKHEIAGAFERNLPEEIRFIETNVMKKDRRTFDVTVTDPSIEKWETNGLKGLYD